MDHGIDPTGDGQTFRDIHLREGEGWVVERPHEIIDVPRQQGVKTNDLPITFEQPFAQVRTDESCSPGNDSTRHDTAQLTAGRPTG
jgi:hypothetical protein